MVRYRTLFKAIQLDDVELMCTDLALINDPLPMFKNATKYVCVSSIPIIYAAQIGSVKCMCELIHRGANVNIVHHLHTPLDIAVRFGHVACVRELISAGANVNFADYGMPPPISTALIYKRNECVSILIEAGAVLYDGLLRCAADNLDGLKLLLSYGLPKKNLCTAKMDEINLEIYHPLIFAVDSGNIATSKLLLKYWDWQIHSDTILRIISFCKNKTCMGLIFDKCTPAAILENYTGDRNITTAYISAVLHKKINLPTFIVADIILVVVTYNMQLAGEL